jgi:hypothetical protein
MQLRDQRNAQVVTFLKFALPGPTFAIDSPNEVVFPSSSLPAPLEQKKTYFAQPIDSLNLNIFSSLSDAKSNSNPIYTTGSMSPIDIDIRKAIVPETKLVFSVRHYFSDGDQVQAFTAGGVLPQPLIANQNYFVNVIDDFSVSLHENQADAAASTPTNFVNPIKITTAGSGTNSLVKLIQATSRVGTESQITAQGLSIATPSGSGAQFQANVVGSVTSVRVTAGGSGYAIAPNVTFSSPTDLPAGSNLQTETATGYAIIVSGAVTNVVILNPGKGYSSAPTVSFDSGVATASATITTSFVSGFTKISGGFNYTDVPQVEISGGGGTGATATATVNNANLSISSITRVGTTATATTATAHGFSSGQTVQISGALESGYNGTINNIVVPQINKTVSSITRVGSVATVTTNLNHEYNTGDRITISGATGTSAGYNNSYNVTVTGPTTFTINVLSTLPTPAVGTIVSSIEDNTATTFTYTVSNTLTTPATGTISVFSGEVTGINIVTAGTGYTTTPTVTITPSTGVFVNFSSTGVLPSPLVSGTAYRAETPLSGITGTFTVKNTDFSDVNITSAGTGTFYVVLSRAFGVDFTNNWLGDFTTLATGQQIYFGTDFILPTTSPAIDNSVTPFFLRVASNTLSRIYTSASSANGGIATSTITLSTLTSGGTTTATATTTTPHYLSAGQSVTIFGASIAGYNGTFTILTASTNSFTYTVIAGLGVPTGSFTATTGLINIDSFGTGQTYYAIRTQVSPSVDSNLIKPVNTAFLTEDQVVQFSSSNILPTPLIAATNYTIKIIGDSVRVYNGASPVILSSTGSGQLSLDIIRDVVVQPSNNIVADSSLYETGTVLVARAKEGDTLPTGLVSGTNYYVRRINNNSFELYDTLSNARNLTSTTGRRTYTTTGNSVSSTFFVDAISDPIFVKSVAHIEKPLTDGYVSLYAWDYGRSNDMTLIGQYHPTEINPSYRRIRIGKPCAWARIIYKVSNPSISSVYDYIPLEQERAIIAAVHAVDLEDKDFADQAMRYWQIAFGYLKNQQESIDGHAMAVPQINSVCYAEGDGADPVMW